MANKVVGKQVERELGCVCMCAMPEQRVKNDLCPQFFVGLKGVRRCYVTA